MNTFLKQTQGKLIVSCQALEDEPLHSSFIMARMARAAGQANAAGIRANSVVDIQAIQDEVSLPIIGIIKRDYDDSPVYITPTMKEMRAVAATGVAVVATDCTNRPHPQETNLGAMVKKCHMEFPETLVMADTGSIEDVRVANELGFDLIGTTMHGYTPKTTGLNIADNDFEYLKEVLQVANVPVICEGKIDSPAKARRAIDLGAHAVVVGGAITRPQQITKKFTDALVD